MVLFLLFHVLITLPALCQSKPNQGTSRADHFVDYVSPKRNDFHRKRALSER